MREWDLAYRSAEAEAPDYTAALAELQRGILFGVTDCDLYYRMGYCYEKLGKADLAEKAYRMALASRAACPTDILYYTHLHAGMLAFERGDLETASVHFRTASEILPGRWVAGNNLAVVERELGRREGGVARVPPPGEGNPVLARNRAIILAEEGHPASLSAEFEGAAAESASLAYVRADLLNASGRRAEAERAYLASAGGGDPAPYLRAAEIALLEGRSGRFIAALQRALEIDPGLALPPGVSARMEAAGPLLASADGAAAVRDPVELERDRAVWRTALSIDDADAGAHYELARSYEYNGSGERYGAGIFIGRSFEQYAMTLSLRPGHAAAHLALGALYHLVGDHGSALREYDAALEIDGALCAAYLNRGLIRLARRSYAEATRDFNEALRCDPGNGAAHFHAALALAGEGKYEEAIGEYEKALAVLPGDPDCYFNMAQIYAGRLDDAARAAEAYRLYLRSRPDAPDRDEVLRILGGLERIRN